MSRAIVVAATAEAQIRAIDEWWRRERSAAPHLFAEELAEAFDLLRAAPFVGQPYAIYEPRGMRRPLLRGSDHHVYYTVGPETVAVRALWHA